MRPRGGCVRDARTARVRERETHRLGALVVGVVQDFDLDGLRGLAGGEGEVARLGHVVFPRGCGAVARRVVDGDVGFAFAVECHREGERRPFLLAHRRVGDRDGHRPQNCRAHRPFNHPSGFGAHRAGLPARWQRRVEREGHGLVAAGLHDDVEPLVIPPGDPACSGDGAAGDVEHRVAHRLVAHARLGVEHEAHFERALSLVLALHIALVRHVGEGRGERSARYRRRCRSCERPPADAHRARLAARARRQPERDGVGLRGLDRHCPLAVRHPRCAGHRRAAFARAAHLQRAAHRSLVEPRRLADAERHFEGGGAVMRRRHLAELRCGSREFPHASAAVSRARNDRAVMAEFSIGPGRFAGDRPSVQREAVQRNSHRCVGPVALAERIGEHELPGSASAPVARALLLRSSEHEPDRGRSVDRDGFAERHRCFDGLARRPCAIAP